MADVLAALQSAGDSKPVDVLGAIRAAGSEPAPVPQAEPATRGQSFMQGLTDLPAGLGQLAEHVPGGESFLNGVRHVIRSGLDAVGQKDAASLFQPVGTNDFDQIVAKREQDYQQARQAANQTGIDWWRLGGQTANPLNYLGAGKVASTAAGRIGQGVAQGAAIGGAQPSTDPGNFWWDKAKGMILGGAGGGLATGAVEGISAAIRPAITAIRKSLGPNAATPAAAEVAVNDALRSKGIDPSTVDINLLSGLKKDTQEALAQGVEPNPVAVVNRAKAESLPVPVNLMRGQATGDPALFSAEQNMRGIQGVGEPITQRLQEQNSAFIANLDALGAKDAPDKVSMGALIQQKAQQFYDSAKANENKLWSAVRNAQGKPAMMDQFTATKNIRDAMDTPQAGHTFDLLPANIQRTIGELEDGKLPLTVAQMQSLDHQWGVAARGASDGSVAHAINQARGFLQDAPISDDLGVEAKQVYDAARKATFSLRTMTEPKLPNGMPNPAYQPILESVVMKGTAPEKLFDMHFGNAAPSVAAKNLDALSNIDPTAPQMIGKTMMGEIKRQALNDSSAERGTVSEVALRKWANDPVKSARMDALLPKPAVDTFRNLADVVESAKKMPVASTVNTSNTSPSLINALGSMVKEGATGQIIKRLPLAKSVAEGLGAAEQQSAVQSSLQPGVTLKSLLTATPSQAQRRALTSRALIPAAAVASDRSQNQ